MLRKCYGCDKKGEKTIDVDNDEFYIYNKQGFHVDCLKKKLSNGKNKKTENEINIIIENLKEETQRMKKLNKEKDDFVYWIYDHFKITFLNSYFFQRLNEINTGRYKNLSEGISNKDLLEMYKTKISKMDSYAAHKEKTGDGFKSIEFRLVYDLASLVGMYGDFKKWKAKKVIIEESDKRESIESEKYKSISTKEVFTNRRSNKSRQELKENKNEINVDELF